MVNGKTYNTNLQTLRKAAGYKSAREFALSIGMNPKTYTNYEQGVRMMGLEVALNLTDTLGCTLNDLVCYELGINMKTNLQALRKAAGFKSARAFAEHIGMNLRTYTSYEQGEAVMSLEVAWNLANVLNCSLDELAGRTPPVIEQSALDPCKATGFNFAQARSSRNVTQQELADMIGEKVMTYGSWERGNRMPDFAQVCRVADALGCTIDELAGRTLPTTALENDSRFVDLLSDLEALTETQQAQVYAYCKAACAYVKALDT